MQKIKDALVWIDCEMTGLDPKKDELIEVAAIVTDSELSPVDQGIDVLIKPSQRALDGMSDFVRNMHKTSGLLVDLESAPDDMEAAQQQVLDYIAQYTEPGKALLAGNSVGMDRLFLSEYMPKVIDHLHYRLIDVSSIKELAKRWYPKAFYQAPSKLGGHRALGDIQDSIAELKYYRATVMANKTLHTAQYMEAAKTVADWRQQL